MNLREIIDSLVGMVGDDRVEDLGVTIGKAIKDGVDKIVADTETSIDDTKGVALLEGIAKGILEE